MVCLRWSQHKLQTVVELNCSKARTTHRLSKVETSISISLALPKCACKPVSVMVVCPAGKTPVTYTMGGTGQKLWKIATVTSQGKTRWMIVKVKAESVFTKGGYLSRIGTSVGV